MKKWLLITSLLALGAPALADAQAGPDNSRPARDQARPDRSARPSKPGNNRPGQGGPGQGGPGSGGPNRPNPGGPGNGSPNRPNPGGPNRPNPGIPNRPNPGGPNRPGIPSRPTHPPRPSRPNWGWNGHRYRGGAFRYPAGWRYRRWGTGQYLPLLFLSPIYYFNNWISLGIAPPPPGYRWVR
ncbi:MAG TPA: hypothetical protein VG227_02350, partial [Caulobacteraceae bacterium]|nr:hypothetical protein [Caulobacteraceae bacterium]